MKKGFTLLELLAVIVVLAIIALIVTPFVTEAIENSRKGAFKSSVYGLKDAAELYCGQELTKNGGVFNGETFTVSNGELVSTTNPNNKLKFKGSSPVGESSVTISDDCQVTLNVTNGTYFASLEPGEVDVTITEEELASREELAQRLDELTNTVNALTNTVNTNNTTLDEKIDLLTSTVSTNTNGITNLNTSFQNTKPIYAKLSGTLNQNISANTATTLTGYATLLNGGNDSLFETAEDGIIIKRAGNYLISAYITCSVAVAGTVHMRVYRDSANLFYDSRYVASYGGITSSMIAYSAANQKITINIFSTVASQASWANLIVTYLGNR